MRCALPRVIRRASPALVGVPILTGTLVGIPWNSHRFPAPDRDARVMVAAIQGLERMAVDQLGVPPGSTVYLAEDVFLYPILWPDGRYNALGPLPLGLLGAAREAAVRLEIVPISALHVDQSRRGSTVLGMVLGPVDYLADNRALIRAAVHLGVHSQWLYRVVVDFSHGAWRAIELDLEGQT